MNLTGAAYPSGKPEGSHASACGQSQEYTVHILESALVHAVGPGAIIHADQPCYYGPTGLEQIGVARVDGVANTDYIPISRQGIYNLRVFGITAGPVNAALLQYGIVYIQADGTLNGDTGGVAFGRLHQAVASAAGTPAGVVVPVELARS
jgi:hypothetical protein